jgi:dihydroorotate dehydrogenase (NAD+) catalytic subunit
VPRSDSPVVECDVHVGDVHLRSPMMTASGTAGYGAELLGHLDVARLGAVVTKSLAPMNGRATRRRAFTRSVLE